MNSPFVGPSPFAEGNVLFGRDAEIEELRWRIVADRILVLYSSSGAGKTSVLRAKNGLLRKMRDRFRVLPVVRVWDARAGLDVAEVNCVTRTVLAQLQDAGFGEVRAGDTLQKYFTRIPAPKNRRRPTRLLMVIDQAEEIFAPVISTVQQREFFRQLGELLSCESMPVWFVLSMREEYFPWLDPFRELVLTRLSNSFRLTPLSVAQAVQAIKGPAQALGVQFPVDGKEDAAQKLARQLSETRVRGRDGVIEIREISVEPVPLQVICSALWKDLSGKGAVTEITVADIETHKPAQALEAYCDQTLDQAAAKNPRARKLRDWIERKLMTPSGLRAQATVDDTETDKPSRDELRSLLDAHLIRELIRPDGEWYELSHDSLTVPVRASIEKWRIQNSQLWQRLARSWQLSGRSSTFLKSLSRASFYSIPLPSATHDYSEDEAQFLEMVQAYREQKRKERLLIIIFAGLLLIVACGLIYSQRSLIKTKANLLSVGNVMATQTALMTILGDNPGVSMGTRAAVAGLDLQRENPAQVGFDFRAVLSEQLNKARQIEKMEILGTKKSLRVWSDQRYRVITGYHNIEETSEEQWQLTVSEMATGKDLWTADFKLLATVHPFGISCVALLPDGRMATAGFSGEIAMWDIGKGALVEKNIALDLTHPLAPLTHSRIRALVSLDSVLVAGNDQGVVAVWRASAQAGKPRLVSALHLPSTVSAIAPFDGGRLAVAEFGEEQRVNLLSLKDGVLLIDNKHLAAEPKEGDFRGAFYSVAVSPDGKTVAAGNRAGKIHFWDIASGMHKGMVDGHLDNVVHLTYLQNDSLLSAGWDGRLKLWWLPWTEQQATVMTLLEVPKQINRVAPGRTGDSVLVTTEKGDIFSVSLQAMRHPLGQFFPASGTTASQLLQSDGNLQIATASADGLIINLFEPSTGRRPNAARHFSLPGIATIAWAPANSLFYAGQNNTIKLIRRGMAEPVDVQDLELTQSDEITAMTTNVDGSIIAALSKLNSKSSQGNIKIWAISPENARARKCSVDYPLKMAGVKTQLIAFRPKHAELVTVNGEIVNIWTVSLNGQGCPVLSAEPKLVPGEAYRGEIRAISFDTQGNQLFMANFAGVISSARLGATPAQTETALADGSAINFSALASSDSMGNFVGVISSVPVDTTSPQAAAAFEDDSTINISAIAGSDSGVVALGDYKGKLYILYPGNKLTVPLVQDVHSSTITSLSMSADGRWLTSSDANVTALWDLNLDSWANKACTFLNNSSFTPAERLKFFKAVEGEVNPCSKSRPLNNPIKPLQVSNHAN